MPFRSVPGMASVAHAAQGRMSAPAAERNRADICAVIEQVAPAQGHALELASGTGQHVVLFAERMPGLIWQPTEIDPARRASVDLHVADTGLSNVAPAMALDATTPGWEAMHSGQDLIVLINLLHLISDAEAETLIHGAAGALNPGGVFVIYGPFQRGGELTSEGDERFHASLRAHDPEIGYKDDFDVMDLLQGSGLEMAQVLEMPANNLSLVAKKPGA
jgi:SAM-dependent methyltransferase